MSMTQFEIPEELDRKIKLIQLKKGLAYKPETIIYILEKALKDVTVDDKNIEIKSIK